MRSAVLFSIVYFAFDIHCLSLGKSTEIVHNNTEIEEDPHVPRGKPISNVENCDITLIPAMDAFDMDKFSGTWYELAKTVSGYIDVDDAMWKFMVNNASKERYKFLYSGRDANGHCIRPIPGLIEPTANNPGEIRFKYWTYSTQVSEILRVLFTDYDNFAVLYTCAHVNEKSHKCHQAGVYGAIWTRKSHVQHEVFDRAAAMLSRACISKNTLRIRLLKGPCKVDDLGIRDDMIPAPNICHLPVSPGSCQAQIKRYYYNQYMKDCLEFDFSGCGGNKNNFLSKNECANMCTDMSSKDTNCRETSVCALGCPPCCNDVGDGCVKCSCENVVVDPPPSNCFHDESQCHISGCEAEERYPGCFYCVCEDHYPDVPDGIASPVCLEVKDKGQCSAREERFYFNVLARRCEKFNYTGCGGNKNNFVSLEKCDTECKVSGSGGDLSLADPLNKNDDGPDGANKMLSTSYISFLGVFFSIWLLR